MKMQYQPYALSYAYNKTVKGFNHEHIENRLKHIRPYVTNVHKVLELGCGDGLLGEQIKKEMACEMHGMDISPSGVELAKKRGIKAILGDLNNALPFPDSYFDVILSDQVLEHVYKTDSLLSEIFRILKPGGIIITITPNLSFWLNRILFVFGVYPIFLEAGEHSKVYGTKFLKKYIRDTGAMGHIHVFNKPALEDIFRTHGFTITRVFGEPLSWNLPKLFWLPYNIMDSFFSKFPSLARDIAIIAMKRK